MATYKVLQDIEAEDKILGPLTLKQFVFAGITIALGGVGYFIASNTHFAAFVPFLVPMIPFGFLAAPIGRDQPNDVWLAARLRYLFKPKTRIWDQTGQQEFVTITVPKKEEHRYTDGLNRDQVVSRLKALANTVDSRGWAVKNVNLNLSDINTIESNDRLIQPSEIPQAVQEVDVQASDDIMDNNASSVSQHFQQLIDSKAHAAREEAIAKMHAAAATQVNMPTSQQDSQTLNDDEQTFLQNLHEKQHRLGIDEPGMPHTQPQENIQQSSDTSVAVEQPSMPSKPAPNTAKSTPSADIINKFADNDVFTVATIQEQVNKSKETDLSDGFEIELH